MNFWILFSLGVMFAAIFFVWEHFHRHRQGKPLLIVQDAQHLDLADDSLHIGRYLDCCTGHVSQGDLDLLASAEGPVTSHDTGYGFWVYVPEPKVLDEELQTEIQKAGFTNEFLGLMVMCSRQNVGWLKLDADGTSYPFLPYFVDDEESLCPGCRGALDVDACQMGGLKLVKFNNQPAGPADCAQVLTCCGQIVILDPRSYVHV